MQVFPSVCVCVCVCAVLYIAVWPLNSHSYSLFLYISCFHFLLTVIWLRRWNTPTMQRTWIPVLSVRAFCPQTLRYLSHVVTETNSGQWHDNMRKTLIIRKEGGMGRWLRFLAVLMQMLLDKVNWHVFVTSTGSLTPYRLSHKHRYTQCVCTVRLSYGYSSIRPFNWTTVLVPVYKHQVRIDLLSSFATVGGVMPCSAGCY